MSAGQTGGNGAEGKDLKNSSDEGVDLDSNSTRDRVDATDERSPTSIGPVFKNETFNKIVVGSMGAWRNLEVGETMPLQQDDLTKFSELFQAFLSDLNYEGK